MSVRNGWRCGTTIGSCSQWDFIPSLPYSSLWQPVATCWPHVAGQWPWGTDPVSMVASLSLLSMSLWWSPAVTYLLLCNIYRDLSEGIWSTLLEGGGLGEGNLWLPQTSPGHHKVSGYQNLVVHPLGSSFQQCTTDHRVTKEKRMHMLNFTV